MRAHLQVRHACVREEKLAWNLADEAHKANSTSKECYDFFGGLRAPSPLRFLRWLLWSFAWLGSVLASLLTRKARIAQMAKYVGGCEDPSVDIEGAHNQDSYNSWYQTFQVCSFNIRSAIRITPLITLPLLTLFERLPE